MARIYPFFFWIWIIFYTNLMIWMMTISVKKVFISSKTKPSISHGRLCAGHFHSKVRRKSNFPIKQKISGRVQALSGHLLVYIIFSLFTRNYSMIVATLPDPTARPPSRYQTSVLQCANGDFSCNS